MANSKKSKTSKKTVKNAGAKGAAKTATIKPRKITKKDEDALKKALEDRLEFFAKNGAIILSAEESKKIMEDTVFHGCIGIPKKELEKLEKQQGLGQ
jgi:hypothetical protein